LHAAEELLDALLDISRLDSGAIRAEISDFPAHALLESLQEQFAPVAAQRGIELRVHTTSLCLRTDQRMLRRVLQNFLGNALRYTRSGRVVVGCRRRGHGNEVEFQVLDTGPGVPVESQHAIFEEFRRLDQQSPWGEKGLGLGLSICDRIARVLGARLTLHSRPGQGSAFGICVQRGEVRAAPLEPVQPIQAIGGQELQGLCVLCIDDDPDILDAMRELLSGWHMQPLCAASVEEAQQLISSNEVDVILADYHLDGEARGLDLLDALVPRDQASIARAGALVTADASEAVMKRAQALGFPVLRKPVRPAALRATIVELARRSQAQAVEISSVDET
jgi:CheY-like chemotaxis protein